MFCKQRVLDLSRNLNLWTANQRMPECPKAVIKVGQHKTQGSNTEAKGNVPADFYVRQAVPLRF